ncbi:hypothetical protein MUB24_20910 [Lederbergia sp. NSJ-179]|nr:flagellin [Lederbergia sp. NSJ-179]MCJ7843290.1 hypothetical protein [Lederbergia sp. NSJ-179]
MISLIQTAEGALNETHAILQRMRELTVQAGNTGTQESEDLQAIQDELVALTEELGGITDGSQGISDRTQFNGKDLLNGDFAEAKLTFQIGANQGQQLEVNIKDMSAAALLGIKGADDDTPVTKEDIKTVIDVTKFAAKVDGNGDIEDGTGKAAYDAQLGVIDKAIKDVSTQRSALGAVQNRLEHTINNLGTSSENLSAAESRIRDVDYALAA